MLSKHTDSLSARGFCTKHMRLKVRKGRGREQIFSFHCREEKWMELAIEDEMSLNITITAITIMLMRTISDHPTMKRARSKRPLETSAVVDVRRWSNATFFLHKRERERKKSITWFVSATNLLQISASELIDERGSKWERERVASGLLHESGAFLLRVYAIKHSRAPHQIKLTNIDWRKMCHSCRLACSWEGERINCL